MKWLIGLFLVLALLVAVGDRVGEGVAEDALADQLTEELGSRPEVEIGGFPFLTQAVRGRYDEIRASAPRVQQGAIALADVRSVLRGVQVPLSDAVGGSVDRVPVEELTASGLVSYDDLETASGAQDVQLEPDPQGVRVTGRLRVLGQDLPATAVSQLSLDGDVLVVTASSVEVGGAGAGEQVSAALRGRLDLRIPVPELPYGIRLSSVLPGPGGVTVQGSARDVVLTR